MGSIAGPLCACALIIQSGEAARTIATEKLRVNDSKQLSRRQREDLFPRIVSVSTYAIGWVSVEEINKTQNIRTSGFVARQRAVANLITDGTVPRALISDAFQIKAGIPCIAVPKADCKSFTVACASIIAKCTRDRVLISLHNHYPYYNFRNHVGYPTPAHMWAIRKFGEIPSLHRSHMIGKHMQAYLDRSWDDLLS
jgi:ribonuclease HII